MSISNINPSLPPVSLAPLQTEAVQKPLSLQMSTLSSLQHASKDEAGTTAPAEPFYKRAYVYVRDALLHLWNKIKSLVCYCSCDATLARDVEALKKLAERGYICISKRLGDEDSPEAFLGPCYSCAISVNGNTFDGLLIASMSLLFKDDPKALKTLSQTKVADLVKLKKLEENPSGEKPKNKELLLLLDSLAPLLQKFEKDTEIEKFIREATKLMFETNSGQKARLLATGNALLYTEPADEADEEFMALREAMGGKPADPKGADAFRAAKAAAEAAGTLRDFYNNK